MSDANARWPICLVSRFEAVDAAAFHTLVDELRKTAASVTDEPGHVAYELLIELSTARTLYVVERWATEADARRHEQLVVSNGAVDRVAPLLAEPINTVTLAPVPAEHEGGDPR
ncbi:putative quinol monooxygenase [Actinoplanes sp. M2I2]|uniref:putative quinol monooxygenase n=1 Tax=Actinoplanes sp. M2I2 TaxID=1734444 RepID=UPI002020DE39|nr:antibiotic biosynthesis monooxygenase family protein [Actinoplanes sp. M2I2]